MMNLSKRFFYCATVIVVVALVFGGGFFLGKHLTPVQICAPQNLDFSLFWDAYQKLHQHFINPDAISDQKVLYGAIAGMTRSLQDPYTSFFDPAQAKTFAQDLAGSFDGIGVEVGVKKGQLTVISPLKGTPGERAGLQPGDQIVKIDGKSSSDMSEEQAVNLIRGKKGTQVILTVYRDDWNSAKDFSITRDTIKVDSITWELKNGNVAYITIHQFDQSLSADFRKAAFEIMASPAKKIVLDLRNNPGGYLEVAQDVAGWFLKNGQVVTVEDFGKDKTQQSYKTEGNASLAGYPIVVLINKGSASASEILAGALRDDRGVSLVGEKSFGKGSVQEVVTLRDGSSFLKITIAKWLTPKLASISEIGLTPDVPIQISDDDIKAKKDPQLEKALELIATLR